MTIGNYEFKITFYYDMEFDEEPTEEDLELMKVKFCKGILTRKIIDMIQYIEVRKKDV